MVRFKDGMRPIHPGEILREDFLVPLQPFGHITQGLGSEAARSPLCLASLLDQSHPLQHPQVLRDGGQGQVEGRRQLGDRSRPLRQAGDDGSPRRVCQSGKDRAEVIGLECHLSHRLINLPE